MGFERGADEGGQFFERGALADSRGLLKAACPPVAVAFAR